MKSIKTVGELKVFIKDLPDDMLLVSYENNTEEIGYRNMLSCEVKNMKGKTEYAYDVFDGIDYPYEVLVGDENGIPCLIIS